MLKYRITTRVIAFSREHVTSLTKTFSEMHYLIEIHVMFILNAIKSNFNRSHDKQTSWPSQGDSSVLVLW